MSKVNNMLAVARGNDAKLKRHTRFWTTLVLYDLIQVPAAGRCSHV